MMCANFIMIIITTLFSLCTSESLYPVEKINHIVVSKPAFGFSTTHSDNMVLQQSPAMAAVYGSTGLQSLRWNIQPVVKVTVSTDTEKYTTQANISTDGKKWKALLRPTKAGGDFTITATCSSGCNTTAHGLPTITLKSVTFGDVWYCSGQSNMWLPLLHTFSRNKSMDAIRAGKYKNIRMMAGDSQQHATDAPWKSALAAISDGDCNYIHAGNTANCSFLNFAAACYYFAESLSDLMLQHGKQPPPIGLVSTAVGGSMIEEWVTNSTTSLCKGANDPNAHNQKLWDQNVVPFLSMTIKGWIYYQGENNMHGVMGNSAQHVGYGCQMPSLVSLWRNEWSAVPGTTDPLAPFGLVTLAAGTDEGGKDMGSMRWSQTANFGILPNSVMPNTFLAQAYDLGEPWAGSLHTCVKSHRCCDRYSGNITKPRNMTSCTDKFWQQCKNYCTSEDSSARTAPFMGSIHPRNKKPVGKRLAQAALVIAYDVEKLPFSGPTITGCNVVGTKLTVRFNTSLLVGDSVEVQPYGPPPTNQSATISSSFHVLIDPSFWCSNTILRCEKGVSPPCNGKYEWFCADKNAPNAGACGGPVVCGKGPLRSSFLKTSIAVNYSEVSPWIEVDLKAGTNHNDVIVDLAKLNSSTPLAIRYAWQDEQPTCCVKTVGLGTEFPCPMESCPIIAKNSRLPANPFIAQIIGGKCKCVEPQICDA